MMKYLLIVLSVCIVQISNAQTLFTVGKETVTKQQFLANYNKNYGQSTTSKLVALKENLDLLVKYKLKVKAAYDAKLDTLPNQKEELQNFRRQIEDKYLTEEKMMRALVQEAHKRMQQDIRLSHIITFIDKSGDTAMAFKKIQEAYKKLQSGATFETTAVQFSEDKSVNSNNGDLSYITAFTLPYDLENLAYGTPLNKYSAIYKSKFGYHIFKRTAERPAIGKMQAAQILIQNMAGSNPDLVKGQAEMVYQKYVGGETFESLARTYSNDMYSASNGGVMQEFNTGKYDAAFEQAYMKLKDGEVSKPFLTSFGWHILKRIKNIAPSKTLDATTENEITFAINNDSRKLKAEEMFIATVLKQINYKPGLFNTKELTEDAQNKLNNPEAVTKIKESTVIHTFNTVYKVTAGDFFKFANDVRATTQYKNTTTDKLLTEYVKVTAKEYYKNNLEIYNADYKAQLQEFKDGNLLFEVMERNVWNKSASDEVGLNTYYINNKNKYAWSASADAVIFNANNLTELNALSDKLNGKLTWQEVLKAHENYVRADSGRYELSYIPVQAATKFAEGTKTATFSPNNDGNYVFAYILKLYTEGQQKSYEEAKGLVMNDYQTKLEEEWIIQLKKKYPVKVNDAVWKSILNSIK